MSGFEVERGSIKGTYVPSTDQAIITCPDAPDNGRRLVISYKDSFHDLVTAILELGHKIRESKKNEAKSARQA